MNNLLIQVAQLLYPELEQDDLVQKLQTVRQDNPEDSDDTILLELISEYISDEDDEDEEN